jgi:microcystin-dependent protein
MYDGFYPINLEVNRALVGIPDAKSTDHMSRGMDITRTLNGVVQNTASQAIYLNATTPDGRHIFAVAAVVDTNVGHYMLVFPDSMLSVAGAVTIELMIIDPSGTISTNTGTIQVTQAVTSYAAIMNSEQYPALIAALVTIQTMNAQLATMQAQVNAIQNLKTGTIVRAVAVLDASIWAPLDGGSTAAYSTLSPIFGANFPNMNGKVGVQIDATQTEFNTLGKTGGEKTHLLTIAETPAHKHTLCMYQSSYENAGHYALLPVKSGGGFTDRAMVVTSNTSHSDAYMGYTGNNTAHQNLQPYGVLGKYYVHV